VTVSTAGPPGGWHRPPREGTFARTAGRVILGLIVAAAAYFLLDFGTRLWAESYVAGQVQRSVGMSVRPSVSFGGAVFMPELVGGRLDSASLRAQDFRARGVSFTEIDLHLRDVHFSPGRLLIHQPSAIRAGRGDGTATMTDVQLTEAFQDQGVPIEIRFTPDGAVRVAAQKLPISVKVLATIEHGELVLRPSTTNPVLSRISFSLRLPELVPGIVYRAITFTEQSGELRFTLRNVDFPVEAPSPSSA
jgi:LmeA-like phospholipid-binding